MRVLIVGCGWLGKAIGGALAARGDRAIGVRRRASASAELEELGIEPLAADLLRPGAAAGLPGDVDAVVACLAPGSPGVEAYHETYVRAMRALLERCAPMHLKAFVYTSSTGVFGHDDGREVDERTPVEPRSETARVLARAEEQVLDFAREGPVPACVIRLSGLYGPGRFGVIERVRSGRLALGPGDDAWMNFCHLEDAVRSVLAALVRGEPGTVYHASDAGPARRSEVVLWVADALGIDAPRREAAPAGVDRANRRVRAEWSRARLGVELAYPSFRQGLAEPLNAGP